MNTDVGDSWSQLLGNVGNIQNAFGAGNIQIEVVTYGKGIALLLKSNAAYEERIRKAVDSGVVFAVCKNSMRSRNVKPEDLFAFATPMTFRAANGKQYVVIAAGGHEVPGNEPSDALVAFALP